MAGIRRWAFIVVVALVIVVLLRRHSDPSVAGIHEQARTIDLEAAKALVENIEKVQTGSGKTEVETLLGRADSRTDNEWIYYLDEHSGYTISFDTADRVE